MTQFDGICDVMNLNRSARFFSSATANEGLFLIKVRKSLRLIGSSVQLVSATALAARGD